MNAALQTGEAGIGELAPARTPARRGQLIAAAVVAVIGLTAGGVTYAHVASRPLSFTAQVTATHNYSLNFVSSGALQSITVRPGQHVRAGQTIATQMAGPARSNLASAQAEISADSAELAAAEQAGSAASPNGHPVTPAVLARDKARLAAARAKAAADAQTLRGTTLVAPAAGTVTETAGTPGDTVGPSGVPSGGGDGSVADFTPVVALESGPMTVTARLPSGDIAGMRLRQPVTLYLSAVSQTLAGQVMHITLDPAARPGGLTYDVVIAVQSDPDWLSLGQPVTVTMR